MILKDTTDDDGGLAMQGARVSAAMVLTWFSEEIQDSAQESLIPWFTATYSISSIYCLAWSKPVKKGIQGLFYVCSQPMRDVVTT